MRSLILGLFLALPASALSAGGPEDGARAEIESLLASIGRSTAPAERLLAASERFLGRPYADGPLGEGPSGKYDADPLFRADRFDCTTFVETAAAAALADGWDGFAERLRRIRYEGGTVSFTRRNHFPEADWIPNNVRAGFFADVTREVGGEATLTAEAVIKKRAWYAKFDGKRLARPDLDEAAREKLAGELREETGRVPDREARLDYIPFSAVLAYGPRDLERRAQEEAEIRQRLKDDKARLRAELAAYRKAFLDARPDAPKTGPLERIPSGSIVSFAHPRRPLEALIGTDMIVTHQGILHRKDGELLLRHAASGDAVKDVPFLEFINVFAVPGKLDPRGFHLLELRR